MPVVWAVLIVVWGIISAISKNSQNAQKKTNGQPAKDRMATRPAPRPVRAPSPAPKPTNAWPEDDEEDDWKSRSVPQADPAPARPALQETHEKKPLEAHMHVPEMDREGQGTEGIDCCHDYMLTGPEDAEKLDFLPLAEDEDADERAKALLQGVIYSEILGRRPVKRYGAPRSSAR